MSTIVGRRVSSFGEVERAGDYCGPVILEGDKVVDGKTVESCWFLLPIARDDDAPPSARSMHRVTFPPHTYRECEDGSLEIRNSNPWAPRQDDPPGYIWHGYLDEGHVWRGC